jgi:hypothetical protein
MWSNILLLLNSKIAGRHPQFPCLRHVETTSIEHILSQRRDG